jgi:hypothetical protein
VIDRSKTHPVAPGIMNVIPAIVAMAFDFDIDVPIHIAIDVSI